MKTPLWTLLLLCLCVPGRCDCQRDCLACSQNLPKEQAFSMLVCLVECEDATAPTPTRELCRQAAKQVQFPSLPLGRTMLKREEEEVAALLPADQGDGGLLYSGAIQQFDQVARALGLEREGRTAQLSTAYHSRQRGSEEEEWEKDEEEENGAGEGWRDGAGLDLTKRFGGFLKGKHGYRKLMDPGRYLQKRYGGFIGVRKSARKWNNQKRFSEFLKQYLGMNARSSEFNSISADITRQNEV